MDDDNDITGLRVTVALQALQIEALRAALGWRAAGQVELQLVEQISRSVVLTGPADEAAAAWAVGVLRGAQA